MFRYPRLSWCNALLLIGVVVSPVGADTTIDFESPSLGGARALIINPYVVEGVTFTALPSAPFTGEVVGLVANFWTSACVPSSYYLDQKLGTGNSSSGDNSVGLAGNRIKAAFSTESGHAVLMVSVDIQTRAGAAIELRLFNESGTEVGLTTDLALPADGTCVVGREPSARKRVTASALEPVSYAVMDVDGPYVFVVDSFTFGSGVVPVASTSWGRLKTLYR